MMQALNIDINCDIGESYGQRLVGNDSAIFPYISSASIACGYHGGDAYTIEKTLQLANRFKVRIGAHPSYPDLQGFGRKKMNIDAEPLAAMIKYQVGALKSMTESQHLSLAYVKPHGALYNSMAENKDECYTVMKAIKDIDKGLSIMGLAGSLMKEVAHDLNMKFIAEAFADRTYDNNGKLVDRNQVGAVHHTIEQVNAQVESIVLHNCVKSISGKTIPVFADTLCIHGDNEFALDLLKGLHAMFSEKGISIGNG